MLIVHNNKCYTDSQIHIGHTSSQIDSIDIFPKIDMEHNACLSDLDINKSKRMGGGSFTSYASHCPAIPRNACLNIYNSIKEKKENHGNIMEMKCLHCRLVHIAGRWVPE